nr:hypothetical protein CFP56_17458 [Quercus suber]
MIENANYVDMFRLWKWMVRNLAIAEMLEWLSGICSLFLVYSDAIILAISVLPNGLLFSVVITWFLYQWK